MNSIPQSGIYRIQCTPTGKFYIGSSSNLPQRWREHLSKLRRGLHSNRHLQNAWNKYGEDQFTFQIIEFVMPFYILEREQYWINELKPFDKHIGFNIARNAESPNTGKHPSPETRAKLSAAHKGQTTWNKGIPAYNKGKPSPSKGIPKSIEVRKKMSIAAQSMSVEHRKKNSQAKSREWIIIDPNGEESRVVNLCQFCKDHDLSTGHMSNVAKGIRSHHKGWKCRRYLPE